jgi:hypothetical protein
MGNFFLIMDQFLLINCLSSYISYINIHLEKKIVDLKTGFLRIVFWTFIEVKRTIQDKKIKYLTIGSRAFLKDKNKNWYLYSVLSGLRNKLPKVRYSYCFSGDSVNNVNILIKMYFRSFRVLMGFFLNVKAKRRKRKKNHSAFQCFRFRVLEKLD